MRLSFAFSGRRSARICSLRSRPSRWSRSPFCLARSFLRRSATGFCDSQTSVRTVAKATPLRSIPFLSPRGDFSIKEVFQPHLPIRLPCYDLALVTCFTLNGSLRLPSSGPPDFHGLTGGVYKARERIHRAMADARLLAIPASRSRVADCDPN